MFYVLLYLLIGTLIQIGGLLIVIIFGKMSGYTLAELMEFLEPDIFEGDEETRKIFEKYWVFILNVLGNIVVWPWIILMLIKRRIK